MTAWIAAIPDAVDSAISAPSSSASARSSASWVGFEYLVYECPGRRELEEVAELGGVD